MSVPLSLPHFGPGGTQVSVQAEAFPAWIPRTVQLAFLTRVPLYLSMISVLLSLGLAFCPACRLAQEPSGRGLPEVTWSKL